MSKTVTCRICDLTDNTGYDCPSDMDSDVHKGFTIGKGKRLYWMMIWHNSGHVTVFTADGGENMKRRWISGDTIITIHWK
jgi:hypothetical protein